MEPFTFPQIDPVIFHIWGPVALRWYNLAYLLGFILGLLLLKWWGKKEKTLPSTEIEQFLPWAILSVVLGGRIGEFLFYPEPTRDISEILYLWEGGMSFHGALVGLMLGTYLFTRKHKKSLLLWCDHLALVAPIGLFFGRIANFINDELYGRVTTVWWAVRFPSGGYLPRHPSQLYEALLEGIILFLFLNYMALYKDALKRTGRIFGFFLIGYGVFRFGIEFVRESDGWIGALTLGQTLSFPMIIGGAFLLFKKHPPLLSV